MMFNISKVKVQIVEEGCILVKTGHMIFSQSSLYPIRSQTTDPWGSCYELLEDIGCVLLTCTSCFTTPSTTNLSQLYTLRTTSTLRQIQVIVPTLQG